jgi:hypothetical protein
VARRATAGPPTFLHLLLSVVFTQAGVLFVLFGQRPLYSFPVWPGQGHSSLAMIFRFLKQVRMAQGDGIAHA